MKFMGFLALLLATWSAVAQPARPSKAAPKPVRTLDASEVVLAERVVVGRVPCELGAHVHIKTDEKNAGYFYLELGKQVFHMLPVMTSTGAIRLEDPVAGAVWLQLGNKSMLMNQKIGKRLADACVNDEQQKVADAMERSPQAGLLDDPVKPSSATK